MDLSLDWHVLAFTFAVAIGTGLIFRTGARAAIVAT
jgi:hypothetical protein